MSYETQSCKTPHETQRFQEKLLLLQTNDVKAMFLPSRRVSEMQFPARDLKFKNSPFGANHGSTSQRYSTKQTIKKLNLWGKTTADKSIWIKP